MTNIHDQIKSLLRQERIYTAWIIGLIVAFGVLLIWGEAVIEWAFSR